MPQPRRSANLPRTDRRREGSWDSSRKACCRCPAGPPWRSCSPSRPSRPRPSWAWSCPGSWPCCSGACWPPRAASRWPPPWPSAPPGALAGDSAGYWIGRRWGPRLLASRLGRRVGPARLHRVESLLLAGGGRALVVGRCTAGARVVLPGLAGMLGLRYRTFALWTGGAAILWAVAHVLAGYAAGPAGATSSCSPAGPASPSAWPWPPGWPWPGCGAGRPGPSGRRPTASTGARPAAVAGGSRAAPPARAAGRSAPAVGGAGTGAWPAAPGPLQLAGERVLAEPRSAGGAGRRAGRPATGAASAGASRCRQWPERGSKT